MKRRELIKSSILGIGASALALSGCNNENKEERVSNNDLKITPKQTGIYEFSCPDKDFLISFTHSTTYADPNDDGGVKFVS